MPFDFLKPKSTKTVHKYPTDFLLGDLLVKSGVITEGQLDEAIKLSGPKHLQLGQMLIMAGYISPRDLQAAVDAQSMLRDRTIDYAMATKCLKIACKMDASFSEVVNDQNLAAAAANTTNRLGEILLESGLIDGDQFAKAMQRSMSTGLPLGRMLVLNGAMQDSILTMALEIQVRIRDGMSTREEAVQALSSAAGVDPISQEETIRLAAAAAFAVPPRKKGVRIGELMVMAGLLAETDVMNCLELGLMQNVQIGQMMVANGFVDNETLEASLELQKLIDEDQLLPQEAADILSKVRSSGGDVAQAVEEFVQAKPEEPKPIASFDKLLLLSRVVTEEDVESALVQAATSPQVLSRVLNLTGYIDEATMQAVLQAYTMMTNGFLSQDDTVIALDYCLHKPSNDVRATFGQALSELGWNAMVPLQMQSAHSVDISQVRLTAQPGSGSTSSVAQEFAESTLGALAELESQAKAVGEALSNESNGQAQDAAFWGEKEQREAAEAAAALEAEELALAAQEALAANEAGEGGPSLMDDLAAAAEMSASVEIIETSPSLGAALEGAIAQEEAALAQEKDEPVEAKAGIDSAALLAAELAKMSGAEDIISQLKGGEKKKVEDLASQVVAEISSGADESQAEVAAAAGEAEPPDQGSPAAASLLAELEAASPTAEPANGAGVTEEAADLLSAAAESISAEAKPPDSDAQRVVPRKSDVVRDAQADEEDSLRDLFSERLHESDDVAPTPTPAAAAASKADKKGDEPARTAQELMEELLSRAAADDASKKDEEKAQVQREAEIKATQERLKAEASAKREAEERDAEAKRKERQAEEQVRRESEAKARKEAEEKARKDAEERAKRDAEELQRRVEAAKREAQELRETEGRKKLESDELARRQAEDLVKLDEEHARRKAGKDPVSAPAAVPAAPAAAAPAADQFWAAAISQTSPSGEHPVLETAAGKEAPGQAPPPATEPKPEAAAATLAAIAAPGDPKNVKNAELLAAATRAAKAVEQAEPGSPAKEELKGVLIQSLSRLAESYYEQGDYAEAQGLYERILMLRQSQLGPKHASLGADLTNLAGVLCVQGKFSQAEPFVKRVVSIVEGTEPLDHLKLAESLGTLAGILFQQGKYQDCEPLLEKALKLKQEKLGDQHREVADSLKDYAKLLKKLGRDTDAERTYMQAKAIIAKGAKAPVA